MHAIELTLRHTPIWVWAAFAYFIWVGVRRMGPVSLPLARVAVTPVIFIVMGIVGAIARHQPAELAGPAWVGAALPGAALGVLTAPRHVEYDRAAHRVRFQGSVFPLIRNLVAFGLQYGLAVAAGWGGGPRLALWAIAASGLSAGYFLGWSGALALRLARRPATGLRPATA